MELYFGQERIPEYGGTPYGIYFVVYDKARLDSLAGKEIRFRFRTEAIQSFGQRFQPEAFAPFDLTDEKEALARKP